MLYNSVIPTLYTHYLEHRSISIDSRHIVSNTLFFAFKGPNFDGNTFAEEALEQGADFAVIDDPQYEGDDRYILVDSVLETLQMLAQYHRRQLRIPVMGITGSSGKTTTKELVKAVLDCRYITSATEGNLNNHIGVPLTILNIDEQVEVAIVEMGANHVGDIARLCEIAMPTHGLITNVGHVHIEGFGSFEGVVKGKSELYDYLYEHGGVVFVNSGDVILSRLTERFAETITYPQSSDFYHCELIKENPFVVYKSENGAYVTSHLLGNYHFYNIAAALCVAKYFQVDENEVNRAIQAYRPSNNRSQIIKKGTNTILLDAYNANLESMKGAIEALNLMPSKYKVLILGDMAELGAESEAAHQELGSFTTRASYKMVLLCGPQMIAAKKLNPASLHFPSKEALITFLEKQQFEDTGFLIKGSRFLQLETLIKAIC